MWNERISKVISLSTARRMIRSQSLYSRVARRKPLIGPNNRYAIKYHETKLLVGMCIITYITTGHKLIVCLYYYMYMYIVTQCRVKPNWSELVKIKPGLHCPDCGARWSPMAKSAGFVSTSVNIEGTCTSVNNVTLPGNILSHRQ